jgi:hypothetical protein
MEIQSPRFNEMLRRLMSMKVPSPSPELSADIVPVVVAEPYGPEHRFLAGDRIAFGGGAFNALAANATQIQINAPVNGVIITVEGMWFSSDSAARITFHQSSGQGSTAFSTVGPRDSRWPRYDLTGGVTAAITGQQSVGGVGLGTQVGQIRISAATPLYIPMSHVLNSDALAGAAFVVLNRTVNTALEVNFWWRERAVTVDELVR